MKHKKYNGITIKILIHNNVQYQEAMLEFAREFSDITGAEIIILKTSKKDPLEKSWWELKPRVIADMASNNHEIDIFCNDMEFIYEFKQWLLPMNDFLKNTEITTEDTFKPISDYWKKSAYNKGNIFGIPIRVRIPLIVYRNDLIKKFPANWKDFDTVLEGLTDSHTKGICMGIKGTGGGLGEHLCKLFLSRYWSLGGKLLSSSWEPLIHGNTGIAALKMLMNQIKRFCPEDVLNWTYDKAVEEFTKDDIAILEGIYPHDLVRIFNNYNSRITDRWSIGAYPGEHQGFFTSHHMVIFKTCKYPQAAFDFISYCSSYENASRLMCCFGENTANRKVWKNKAAKAPYLNDVVYALDRGVLFMPDTNVWLELLISMWPEIEDYINGRLDEDEVLNNISSKWDYLLFSKQKMNG